MSLRKICNSEIVKKCVVHAQESRKGLLRGMASYAVIWPLGSVVQQKIEGREELDYWRVCRFLVYGSLYVAPTLTIWMTIARVVWPQNNLRSALTKVTIFLCGDVLEI